MILSINNDPIVWNLYNEETQKIDNKPIFQYIKYNTDNDFNDYYSALNTKSEVIKDDSYLKELYINQIAYVVYNIKADFYNILKNEMTYYNKYHEQYDKGNVSGAQICIAKAGYKTYNELKARFDKYNEIYTDITDKYNQFERFLLENNLLTISASINGRSNEVNQLAEETYLNNINEHVENVKDDLATNKTSHSINLEILEEYKSDLDALYDKNKEYENQIELQNVILKSKLLEREERKSSLEELQKDNDAIKAELNFALEAKTNAENDLNVRKEEIDFYKYYKESYNTSTSHIDEMLTVINGLQDGEVFNSINFNDEIIFIKRLIDETLEKIDIKQICDETEDLLVMYNNFINAAEEYKTSDIKLYLDDMKINISNILRYIESEIIVAESNMVDYEFELGVASDRYNTVYERYTESSEKVEKTETSLNQIIKEIAETNNSIEAIKKEQDEVLNNIKTKESSKYQHELQTKYTEFLLNINLRSLEVLENLQKEMSDLQKYTNDHKEEVYREISLAKRLDELNQGLLYELEELAKDETNTDPKRVSKVVSKYYEQSVYNELLSLENIRIYV